MSKVNKFKPWLKNITFLPYFLFLSFNLNNLSLFAGVIVILGSFIVCYFLDGIIEGYLTQMNLKNFFIWLTIFTTQIILILQT